MTDFIAYNLSCIAALMPDRRERIATAAMQGLLAHYGETSQYDNAADCSAAAVAYADALIAELDKEVKP